MVDDFAALGCAAALGKWCGAVKSAGDTTACDRCVLRSDDPLTAAGCTVAEAAAFCPTHTKKPPTAPPKCQAALEKACGPAQPKGNRACMLCVYASKKDGSTLEVAVRPPSFAPAELSCLAAVGC